MFRATNETESLVQMTQKEFLALIDLDRTLDGMSDPKFTQIGRRATDAEKKTGCLTSPSRHEIGIWLICYQSLMKNGQI